MAEEFNYEYSQKAKEEINGRFVLALINICEKLESGGVIALGAMLLDRAEGLDNIEEIKTTIKNDRENIRGKLKIEMQVLFNNYSYLYGNSLSNIFYKYLKSIDWINTPEPRDLNPIIFEMNKRLSLIATEIEIFFNEKPLPKPRRNNKSNVVFQTVHIMEQLLAKKTKIFANVERNRKELIMSIMQISLKALYEEIRRLRVSKFGYQQIQIDMRFLRTLLEDVYSIDDDTGLLRGLFYEVVHSARLRCFDPVDIDETIIEAITDVKLKKIIG